MPVQRLIDLCLQARTNQVLRLKIFGMANAILSTVDLNADVASWRQHSEPDLVRELSNLFATREEDLDDIFRSTCRLVAVGYALLQNALRRSGMRNFKPAMRQVPAYRSLPHPQKKRIEINMTYIKCIFENWDLIVSNCTLPIMTDLDIRPFPLWKLSRCITLSFVENENNKVNRVRKRPTQRAYALSMVDDIVSNVDGSTQALLDLIGNDEDQLKKIADDFHKALVRRVNGSL